MWPKEKLLTVSHFTFRHNVFKSRLGQNASVGGKGWETRENYVEQFFVMINFLYQPFPTYRRFLMPLQQTIFKITVAKGEIAHYPQQFQLSTLFNNHTIIYKDFLYFGSFQSHLLQIYCMWERVNLNVFRFIH